MNNKIPMNVDRLVDTVKVTFIENGILRTFTVAKKDLIIGEACLDIDDLALYYNFSLKGTAIEDKRKEDK